MSGSLPVEAHTACDKNGYVLETVVTPGNIHDSVAFDDVYDKVAESFPQIETIVADSAYKTPHICSQCPTRERCTRSKSCVKTVLRHVWKDYEELADDARYTPEYKELYAKRKETIERVFADAKEKHGMSCTLYSGLAQVSKWVRLKFAAMNLKKLAKWKVKQQALPFLHPYFAHIYPFVLCGLPGHFPGSPLFDSLRNGDLLRSSARLLSGKFSQGGPHLCPAHLRVPHDGGLHPGQLPGVRRFPAAFFLLCALPVGLLGAAALLRPVWDVPACPVWFCGVMMLACVAATLVFAALEFAAACKGLYTLKRRGRREE